jgi:DNA (cytosine-5)-methyltransferase 1
MVKNLKFIDLFAGIGGFHIALKNLGGECVFASEIDPDCTTTYKANFNFNAEGDITKINESVIPDHDILCAGFPCQPFSVSGKQKGFEDDRGNLIFHVLRIIKHKQPKVVFLENVKHLKYHNKGETLTTIITELEKLGYKISWSVLNSKDYGTAQNRERIIIIGNKDTAFSFNKIHKKEKIKLKDVLDKEGDFEYLNENEYTIIDNFKEQESGLIFVGYRNKGIRKAGVRPNTEHLSRVHKQPNRIYSTEGTHPTIPSQETAGRFFIYHEGRVRKLTINECFKLMGFPESFKKVSINGKLYNQIGNSVSIPMIEEVAKGVLSQYFHR